MAGRERDTHSLLDELKQRLVIDYDSRDEELVSILVDSEEEVHRLVGSRDLTHPSVCSLILSRARYVFNGQEEFFYDNFQKDIMGLSLEFYKPIEEEEGNAESES